LRWLLDTFVDDFRIVFETLLNAFADLMAAAEFGPEFLILGFPFGTEPFVKKVPEPVKQQFPRRFASVVGPQKVIEQVIQIRQGLLGR